ncbi:disease resistance RPP13-like protein 4 isoform X1 [Dioscorea cayenensis subsp. rotundata]|uniref:Disease resistance RPP13-like protein 4 isoform X1 n=1 Tax=Dioscorea cayennensis subsp. rotundata TaxID=55577 RepID=A0AB40CJ70_DIOCR|nr:disease resistance RPP13-like protein 4 isoform X1 [Dioscorea cayenensis subsp. rotundata]XP_039140084.1 disease resistance RPP13-like protein 4 isoform X1 [Dioscorea cayenensis subsp. rotundata]XP_039140085.1 disease resistance RPP13-like protein 4 isoform X1 [Dioscorea cayenensis subsp. rotundata]
MSRKKARSQNGTDLYFNISHSFWAVNSPLIFFPFSIQVMSKGGLIIQDVVAPLMQQVADAKCILATKRSKSMHNGSSTADGLLQEIENEVLLIKDSFQRLETWIKDVENEVSVVTKNLDDILEGNTGRRVFDSGLQTIHKSIFTLREHVTGPLGQLRCKSSSVGELGGGQCSLTHSLSPTITTEPHFRTNSATQRFEVTKKYEKISPTLRRCLLTLAIFPQDSVIEKRLLIHWWVGEGLVTPTSDHTAEEFGDRYIKDLISEGLIVPVCRGHSSQVKHLRVEQWIREEVIILAMLDKAFSFNGSGELIEALTSSPRACLKESPQQQGTIQMPAITDFSWNNFKTCFNVDKHNLRFERSRFMAMRNAAVMQLGRWQTSPKHHIETVSIEFLEWLACFNKLKYLSLRGISNITKLPRSIGELTDLMILDLRACHNLENLPVEVTMLKKLTYLDVSECYLLDHMPEGLGSLTELRVLKGFVIGNSRSRDPCRLGELARLQKLWKLSISIGRDTAGGKREFHELSQFTARRSLTITWGVTALAPSNGVRNAPSGKSSAGINLSPPPYLEKLDLRCFPRNMAPEWLTCGKFLNLQKLYIRGGSLRRIGVGTELKSVEVLRLRFLSEFRMEEHELRKIFPRLVILEVQDCHRLASTVCKLCSDQLIANPKACS